MMVLRIEGTFHWGYWVRTPDTSKLQASYPIPPPTSLLGALSNPIMRSCLTKKGFDGEVIFEGSDGVPSSPGLLLSRIMMGASIYLCNSGFLWEDINVYTTLHFQGSQKAKPEERAVGGRRYLPQYIKGAIKTGKVYYPSGRAVVAFLFEEDKMADFLREPWQDTVQLAAWSINRLGSKESLFAVDSVGLIGPEKVTEVNGKTKTRFYFPEGAAKVDEGELCYRLPFWKGGWSSTSIPEYSEYIVPGTKSPVESHTINLETLRGFKFGEGEVLIV